MSLMTKSITCCLLFCTLLTACKKKGDNQNLNGANESISEYMSTNSGSWWLYSADNGDIIKRQATGVDSFKEGLNYNYYISTDTTTDYVSAEYFGKNGDKYLTLMDIDGSQTNYLTAIIQKDNAQQGDTWSNTGTMAYSGMTVDLLTNGKVLSTNETITLNNHTYTNVSKVENKLKAKPSFSPLYTNCGTATMWFSKGIGIIKYDVDINILSLIQRHYTHTLLNYHIEE